MINPAITAAFIAAAHEEEIEEKVIGRLRKSGALSPARAIKLDLGEKEQKLLAEAAAAGTVTRTADGRYYLNERAIADRKEGQGMIALVVILVSLSVIASGIALVALFHR